MLDLPMRSSTYTNLTVNTETLCSGRCALFLTLSNHQCSSQPSMSLFHTHQLQNFLLVSIRTSSVTEALCTGRCAQILILSIHQCNSYPSLSLFYPHELLVHNSLLVSICTSSVHLNNARVNFPHSLFCLTGLISNSLPAPVIFFPYKLMCFKGGIFRHLRRIWSIRPELSFSNIC